MSGRIDVEREARIGRQDWRPMERAVYLDPGFLADLVTEQYLIVATSDYPMAGEDGRLDALLDLLVGIGSVPEQRLIAEQTYVLGGRRYLAGREWLRREFWAIVAQHEGESGHSVTQFEELGLTALLDAVRREVRAFLVTLIPSLAATSVRGRP